MNVGCLFHKQNADGHSLLLLDNTLCRRCLKELGKRTRERLGALARFVLANSLLLAGVLSRPLAVVVAAFRRCRSRTTRLALDPVDSEQIERCTNLSVKSEPCTPPRFSLASGPAESEAVRKVDPAEFRREDCGARAPSKIVLRSAIGFVRAAVFGAVVLLATISFLE